MKNYLFLTILLLGPMFSGADLSIYNEEWNLIGERRGVKIFTRDIEGSNLKELRMTFSLEGVELSEVISALDDTKSYKDWVYKCTEAEILEIVNTKETYSYFTYNFPWPMTNRESITYSKFDQDSLTGVVTLTAYDISTHPNAPPVNKMVRIPEVSVIWKVVPKENDTAEIEYFLRTSPGGNIPTWAVNMVIDHGALKTMDMLRELIDTGIYKDRNIPWLKINTL